GPFHRPTAFDKCESLCASEPVSAGEARRPFRVRPHRCKREPSAGRLRSTTIVNTMIAQLNVFTKLTTVRRITAKLQRVLQGSSYPVGFHQLFQIFPFAPRHPAPDENFGVRQSLAQAPNGVAHMRGAVAVEVGQGHDCDALRLRMKNTSGGECLRTLDSGTRT